MSVMVSGRGPSSRRLPASTKGLPPSRTHTSRRGSGVPIPPPWRSARVIDGVDGAHVIAMPVLFLPAVALAHAQRSAQQRRLDIVHAQRVSRQQRLHPAPRINSASGRAPPVCTTTGPATTRSSCPRRASVPSAPAVWRTAVSSWRSEEMPLLMKANASRSRSFDSGTTRMPRMPTTTRSPWRRSRRRRHAARPPSITTIASMRWFSTSIQRPRAHLCAMIGGRIKILRSAAIAFHRESASPCPRACSPGPAVA